MTRSGCCIGLIAITDEQIIICNIGMCRCYATYKKDKSKAILFSGNHIVSNKE
jgi:serine/threonine protein phosphatase PrpC